MSATGPVPRVAFWCLLAGLAFGGVAGWGLAHICGTLIVGVAGSPFGPAWRFELVRVARPQRLHLWRTLYGLALLSVITLLVAACYGVGTVRLLTSGDIMSVGPRKLERLGGSAFDVFLATQLAAVYLLVPVLVAGCIAGERERRTLDFVLTTDLTGGEIVAGKLTAHTAVFVSVLLIRLPAAAVLPALAGANPAVAAAASFAVATTVLSTSALSVFVSASSASVGRSVGRTCFVLFAFIAFFNEAVSSSLMGVARIRLGVQIPPPELVPALNWLCSASPLRAFFDAGQAVGPREAAAVWETYARLHLIAAAVFLRAAAAGVRRESRRLADGPVRPALVYARPERPPVSDRPVLWRAIHCDRLNEAAVVRAFLVCGYLATLVAAGNALLVKTTQAVDLITLLTTAGGGLVVFFAGLHTAMTAARAFDRERGQQTLDALLGAGLPRREILAQTAAGAARKALRPLVWVGTTLAAAAAINVHPAAVPVALTAAAAHVAFAVVAGLWWSIHPRASDGAAWRTALTWVAANLVPLLAAGFVAGLAPTVVAYFRCTAG